MINLFPAALYLASRVALAAPIPAAEFKIVLDPGHGGTDFGATYRDPKTRALFTEKEATLAVAREFARQLQLKKYPVILTREIDADIALTARTAIANREKAKLFVSIHLNSLPKDSKNRASAEGVETYILNNTSDATSRRLAELENKGMDPTRGSQATEQTEVNLILKDLTLDANLPESKRLACALQDDLVGVTRQKPRGVKQALFVVLLGADMPSTLLEAGFVSSEKDRKLLTSPHGLHAIGAAMVRAIERFRTEAGTVSAQQHLSRCKVSEHPL